MKLYIANTERFKASEYEKYYGMMSPERKENIQRLRFENARKQSVLGEMLVRKAINELSGMNESEIKFARTENGKPYLVNSDIKFSISHSKEYVVCAVSSDEIGVDVEKIRTVEARITNISCTETDKEYIFGTEKKDTLDAEMIERFFEVWTTKEAYFKFVGTGIIGLKTVNYSDLKPYCKRLDENGYIITLYSESGFGGLTIERI